jgi:O-antigen/teichoic acid export membrane protein
MLKALIERIHFSEYKKGFFLIFSSKVFIIGITFLTTPILSRIYTPEEYGYFGLMSSITVVMVILSNLTLPPCLLTIKKEEIEPTVLSIVEYAFIINLFFLVGGILVSMYVIQFNLGIVSVCLMTLASFLTTLTQILANLNIREKAFSKNVAVNIVENVVIRIVSLTLGFFGIGKFGLFISDLTGKLTNTVQQLISGNGRFSPSNQQIFFSWLRIREVIVSNKNYALYNLPSTLIASFFNQFILWVLALTFSKSSVGYFTMAIGFLNVPLLLLTNSLQPLITSKFSTEKKELSYQLFLKMTSIVTIISGVIYAIVYAISQPFITIYLGESWLYSISFVQILCIPFALQLIGNSLQGAFLVFDKQRSNFIIKLVFLAILILGFSYDFITSTGLKSFVMLYSVIVSAEELVKILYLAWRLRYVRSS